MGLPVPRYTTISATGPQHAKIFMVESSSRGGANGPRHRHFQKSGEPACGQEMLRALDSD